MKAKRLIIVSGKGGVGKTTVAAGVALACARRGLHTIVVEVAGRRDVPALLGVPGGRALDEHQLAGDLRHMTIDPGAALEDYLSHEVPGPFPARWMARNRSFLAFVEAAPGLRELLTIGKVWELTQHPRRRGHGQTYDVVVLDGPSTGQLLGLLEAPDTYRRVARVGPVAGQAVGIQRALLDPGRTGVLIVATPEQMAVSETLELHTSLRARLGIHTDAVVINRTFPARFSAREARVLSALAEDPAVRSARWLSGRARAGRSQLDRLRRGLNGTPRLTLPFVFTEVFDRGAVEELTDRLERGLP